MRDSLSKIRPGNGDTSRNKLISCVRADDRPTFETWSNECSIQIAYAIFVSVEGNSLTLFLSKNIGEDLGDGRKEFDGYHLFWFDNLVERPGERRVLN